MGRQQEAKLAPGNRRERPALAEGKWLPFQSLRKRGNAQVLFRSTDRGEHWTQVSPDLTGQRAGAQRCGAEIKEAQVGVFGPPPVRGVGRAGGFAIMIEDRGDSGPAAMQKQIDNVVLTKLTT